MGARHRFRLKFRPLRKIARALRLTARMFGALWPFARAFPGLLAGVALTSLFAVLFRLAQPWPLKWVFDGLSGGDTPCRLGAGAFCLAFALLSLAAAGTEALQRRWVFSLANRTVHGFRARLFRHVMALSIDFHEGHSTGELLTRVVSDTARLRRGIAGLLLRFGQSTFLFLANIAMLLLIDPPLAGIVLLSGLASALVLLAGGRRILSAARRNRRHEGRLAAVVEENLQAARELHVYRPEGGLDPRFEGTNRKSLKTVQKVRRIEAAMLFRAEAFLTLALCLVVWIGTLRVQQGILTAGHLVLFLAYLAHLYRPFSQFARQTAQAGRTAACAERLLNILSRRPSVQDAPDAVEPRELRGEIAFENVTVRTPRRRRGSRKHVLDGVTFRLEAGHRLAVLGPNGAGKSTLLRHILRLQDPASGRILLDGRDLRSLRLSWLRSRFSVVDQEPAFLSRSLRDNLWSDSGSPEAALRDARVNGLGKIRRRGRLLSVGERQRIALARALQRNGAIWLLDEPTRGLDPEARKAVQEILLESTRGRTTVWVTHDPEFAMRLDRILALEKGKVTFVGTPEEYRSRLNEKEVPDAGRHPRCG